MTVALVCLIEVRHRGNIGKRLIHQRRNPNISPKYEDTP
jgi:hypothetical protein